MGLPHGKTGKAKSKDAPLPMDCGFVDVSPSSVLLSAVKKAEAGRALIVRLFNPAPEAQTVKVKPGRAGQVSGRRDDGRETKPRNIWLENEGTDADVQRAREKDYHAEVKNLRRTAIISAVRPI
jgi:alpha-mannosidase